MSVGKYIPQVAPKLQRISSLVFLFYDKPLPTLYPELTRFSSPWSFSLPQIFANAVPSARYTFFLSDAKLLLMDATYMPLLPRSLV